MNQYFSKIAVFLYFLFIPFSVYSQSSTYLNVSSFTNKDKFKSSENSSTSDTVKIALKVLINETYHINSYKVNDPTLIKTEILSTSDKFKLLNIYYPPHKKLKFEFSETELDVFEGEIYVGLTFLPQGNLQNGVYDLPVKIVYQACDDKVCYPPGSITANVKISIDNGTASVKESNSEIFKKINFSAPFVPEVQSSDKKTTLSENTRTDSPESNENEVSDWFEKKGLFLSLLLIFLGGLALNLTPCVYPLIPITVSFFGAQGSASKSQSIFMGVFYALGMSITYSALGVFAALTGSLLGNALQNPIVIIGISFILIALGTSMFGLFEIKIPQSLALIGNKNRSGYFGSLLMGLTVGFIAAPCIGPFVLSLLVYVGKSGNPLTGFILFFVLSMGLGLPYIFLAASSSSISKLPRSGEWMEGVKIIFGLILFGMALNTLSPLIPKDIFKYLFPAYIILSGVYLLFFDKKGKTAKFYTKFKFIIAVFAILMGLWMLRPQGEKEEVKWNVLTSAEAIDKSINSENKPVMIDFYADWCAQCKELDEFTYTNSEIVELSNSLNNIKIDLTKENESITNKYNIKGLPVVIFMNSKGEEIKELRVTGFLKPEEFKNKINSLLKINSQK
ncbi:MAG TPA: cytochrome c biogenesis protein CcdA [Ignavibacteria bacterium]|nr:cytochrome c biogenesis protein CcdA [Ignavibacteria bacterium]